MDSGRKRSRTLMVFAEAISIVFLSPFGMHGQSPAAFNSHEVHPDGTITSRYRDTGAKHLQVQSKA